MPDHHATKIAVNAQEGAKPFGVVLIGFLYLLLGLWRIIMGFMLMLSAMAIAFSGTEPSGVTSGLVAALGIGYLIIGFIDMAVSAGLFQGKAWAWTLAFLFSIVNIAGAFVDAWSYGFNTYGLITLIFGLIVPIIVIYYLTQPDVKKTFGKA
ncbi:MAG: hypothetical protein WCK39_11365 [Methanomassiliicoccales archaeon]